MRRLVIVLALGAAVVAALAVAITLAVTSDKDDDKVAANQLTRAEWEAALVDAGASRNSDFDALEDLAHDDCERDEDGWAMYLSLAGAQPEVVRLGLEYLCPDRVKVLEAGQDQLEEAVGTVELACDTPRADRTEEQQEMVEAVGCN